MAEADTSTLGGVFSLPSAVTTDRVVRTRLERTTIFRCCVHRPPMIDAPARFTNASTPAMSPCESAKVNPPEASGSQGTSITRGPAASEGESAFRETVSRRTIRHTLWPSRTNALVSAVPTNPVAPVINTFIVCTPRHVKPQTHKKDCIAPSIRSGRSSVQSNPTRKLFRNYTLPRGLTPQAMTDARMPRQCNTQRTAQPALLVATPLQSYNCSVS